MIRNLTFSIISLMVVANMGVGTLLPTASIVPGCTMADAAMMTMMIRIVTRVRAKIVEVRLRFD